MNIASRDGFASLQGFQCYLNSESRHFGLPDEVPAGLLGDAYRHRNGAEWNSFCRYASVVQQHRGRNLWVPVEVFGYSSVFKRQFQAMPLTSP